MHADFLQSRDVPECYWSVHEVELGGAAGRPQWPVLVVRAAAVPAAETGGGAWLREGAGRMVGVEEREEVGSEG